MAAIIMNILSSTVGLLWNKARDFAAKKPKDGDTTHEKFREIIIRDLNDIKRLSSVYRVKNETAALPKVGEANILNEAMRLAYTMKMLRLTSDEQFKSAKDLFKTAREKATEAFWNESLNVKERIMACKLRAVARILECLENPDLTTTACALFLQELHCLSAVQEIFSVYLSGGLKSMLNKAERFDNVKSVMLTNFTVFDFTAIFGSNYPDIETWPTIEMSGRNFNPARGWYEVWRQAPSDEIILPPKHLVTEGIRPHVAVVNSRSEIITRKSGALRVNSSTKESKIVNFPDPENGEIIDQVLMALAVDTKDNVYAIRWLLTRPNTTSAHVKPHAKIMSCIHWIIVSM